MELLSKSAFARRRGVSPAMIAKYERRGMPVVDGRVPAKRAVAWLAQYNSPSRSGSYRSRQRAAEARPEPEPAKEKPIALKQISALCKRAFRDGVLQTVEGLIRPRNMLTIAQTAAALGCSLQQAVVLAVWYRVWLTGWALDDNERVEVNEPDWTNLVGAENLTKRQIAAWLKASGSAVDKFLSEHPTKEDAATNGK